MCAFIPKCYWLPFLLECISGSRLHFLFFCRTRLGNEHSVHGAAFFEQQALAAQQRIDSRQERIGQLVLFQPVAKPQNGAFVRHLPMRIEPGTLAVQWHVKESLLHCRVRQAESLLQKMCAQHRLLCKGRLAGAPLGVVRGNKRDQRGPRSDALHQLQKLTLAGFFRRRLRSKAACFMVCIFLRLDSQPSHNRMSYAEIS